MTSGTSEMTSPALALINPAGLVERSTDAFTRRCNGAAALIERDPQIDRVLRGQVDRADVNLGGTQLQVEAIQSTDGVRHALLTAHGEAHEAPAGPDGWDEAFDESPALIWLKDLDGRYTKVNTRYAEVLGTSADRLTGHTDAELPAVEVVDGPRLLSNGAPATEPLQLEYTISPFEHRPALAVLRFPVRGADGEPIAVCGVAAPLSEARVARSECARLMRMERWRRLDPGVVRNELIQEWGMVEVVSDATALEFESDLDAPAGREEALDPQPPVASSIADGIAPELQDVIAQRDTALEERDALSAQTEDLQRELGEGRRRIAALHEASATAARRAHELMSALSQEQERSTELGQALEQARSGQPPATEPDEDVLREHRERADQALEELRVARDHVARLEAALDQQQAETARATDELARERELAEAARPARAALQEAQAEAKQLQFELQQAHSGLQRARAEAQKSESVAADARAQADAVAEALESARDEAAAVAAELEQSHQEVAAVAAELEQARAEAAEHVAALEAARTEAAANAEALEHARNDAAASAEAADQARREAAASAAAFEQAHDQSVASAESLDAARAEVATHAVELERAREDLAGTASALDAARAEMAASAATLDDALQDAAENATAADQARGEAAANASALEQERELSASLREQLESVRSELAETDPAAADAALEHARSEAEANAAALASAREEAAVNASAADQARDQAVAGASALEQERELSASLREQLESVRAELTQADLEGAAVALDLARAEAASHAEAAERAREEAEANAAAAEQARAEAAAAGTELEHERQEAASLREQLESARAELAEGGPDDADDALEEARSDAAASAAAADQARVRAAATGAALDAERQLSAGLREQLEVLLAERAAMETSASDSVEADDGPVTSWTPAAQRAFSAALVTASEWRMGLKDVIKVLGLEGGWESVTAWSPGERATLRCVAMWTRDPDGSGAFQTLTWQHPEPLNGSELGRASTAAHPIAIADVEASQDHRFKLAAAEGMRCAMLVPIRDGVSTLAVLELLGRDDRLPDPHWSLSLEAIALQLGHFAHLLRLGAKPNWRLGRM